MESTSATAAHTGAPRGFVVTYLRQWRLRRGLLQRDLSDRTATDNGKRVPTAQISRYEHGAPANTRVIERLAKALGVSAHTLRNVDPMKDDAR